MAVVVRLLTVIHQTLSHLEGLLHADSCCLHDHEAFSICLKVQGRLHGKVLSSGHTCAIHRL